MLVIIKETGERKELNCYDVNSRVDCTEEIIGNSGAVGDYIEFDDGAYIMSEDNYNWWADYLDKWQDDQKAIDELAEEIGRDYFQDLIYSLNMDPYGPDYNSHHDDVADMLRIIREIAEQREEG